MFVMGGVKLQRRNILKSVVGAFMTGVPEDLTPIKSSGRPRKLDWGALAKDIEENPDKLLRERAKELNVWTNAVWYASKQIKISSNQFFKSFVRI